MDKTEIEKGIAAYKHERQVLLRLLRKRGQFTEHEFDKWFRGREFRKHCPLTGDGVTGDSFLLGIGQNGFSLWAKYLDLMQHMMAIDLIDAKTENGIVVYSLMKGRKDGA